MIFVLLSEITFSFSILSIVFFIPIPNFLLTDNIFIISNDISQMSYLGFLLYLILSDNNVNSAKFSSFISVLSPTVTAFNPLNILTVSSVNISASIISLYHFKILRNHYYLIFLLVLENIFYMTYLLFHYFFSFHNPDYVALLFFFDFHT